MISPAIVKLINNNRNSDDLDRRRLARCLDKIIQFFDTNFYAFRDFENVEGPEELIKILNENGC